LAFKVLIYTGIFPKVNLYKTVNNMIWSDWNQIDEEQNNKTIVLENIMSEKWFRSFNPE